MSTSLNIHFEADFADIFEVRGTHRKRRGRNREPAVTADGVTLAYEGLDSVVRRAELIEEVWGSSLWQADRSLDVHMSSLRRKLGDDARNPRYIQTVHGSGFRLLV